MKHFFIISFLWSSVVFAQQFDPSRPYVVVPDKCVISQNSEYEVIYYGIGRFDNFFFPKDWENEGFVVSSNLSPFCLCKTRRSFSNGVLNCAEAYEPSEGASLVGAFITQRYDAQEVFNRLFDNCMIDKMPENAVVSVRQAVRRRCAEIAKQPSFFDKLRYD